MVDVFFIGAYWWNRKEDLPPVVDHTISFLSGLSGIDELFTEWYQLGYNKKESSKRIVINHDNIEAIYKKSIKKTDLNNEGYSKIGYSIGLWTGHEEEFSGNLSLNCGHASRFFSNCCVITLPIAEEPKQRLLTLSKQKSIFDLIIKTWNPDSIILNSNKLKNESGLINEIGWVTYLKNTAEHVKISDTIIHEKWNEGDLYYLNLKNDRCYDYDLIKELLTLKGVD